MSASTVATTPFFVVTHTRPAKSGASASMASPSLTTAVRSQVSVASSAWVNVQPASVCWCDTTQISLSTVPTIVLSCWSW